MSKSITQEELDEWNKLIVRVFDITVYKFVEEHHQHSKRLLEALNKELINELSSPVIPTKRSYCNSSRLLEISTQQERARIR